MGTFGYTTAGAGYVAHASDTKTVSRETLGSAQYITKLTAYVSGLGATGSQVCKAVIYSDSSGPNALLATSQEVTVTSGQAAGWVDFAFTTPVYLTAADYWLGLHFGATSNNTRLYQTASTGTARIGVSDTYSDGPADPCGGSGTTSNRFSIYATWGTLHQCSVAFDVAFTVTPAATVTGGGPTVTAPGASSNHETGAVTGTATFVHPSGSDVRHEWEFDTVNPPASGNPNYQQIFTGYTDTSPRSIYATLTAGTWYCRARVDDGTGTSSWSSVVTFYAVETILLRDGSTVSRSILTLANKVYAKVEGTSTVGTATNSDPAYPPTYASSPREILVLMKAGDATAANAVAAAHLALRKVERYAISGLTVRLQDGLKINVGTLVAVSHALSGTDGWYPVRRVQHDFRADVTTIDVGEVDQPPDDDALLLRVAAELAQVKKDQA